MTQTNTPTIHPGVAALVQLLRFQGLPADPDQIQHRFSGGPFGVSEMLRCAKEVGVKARAIPMTWERLARAPLPGIAVLRDGASCWSPSLGSSRTRFWSRRRGRHARA